MSRLTQRDEYGNAEIIALSDVMPELYAELSFSETNALTNALNKLADYEDKEENINQPTADVQEVRHGEWRGYTTSAYIGSEDEYGDPRYADRRFYRCSECRYGSVVKSNFCPNCGAKMDKEWIK